MATNSDVFTALLELGVPSQLPGLWQRHSTKEMTFFRLAEPEVVLEHFRERGFTAPDLAAAGVLRLAAHGQWRLRPSLRGERLVALQTDPAQPAQQLLAGNDLLPRGLAICVALLLDHRWQLLLPQGEGQVIVASSLAEVAIYWQLGLPAIPCRGLSQLGGAILDTLEKLLEPAAAGATGYKKSHKLVLANWSLATLDPCDPPAMHAVQSHFQLLQADLDFDCCAGTWRPSPTEVSRLATAARFGTVLKLRDMLLESMSENTVSLHLLGTTKPQTAVETRGPSNYSQALQNFLRSANQDPAEAQVAWSTLQELQEHELIAPLVQHAQQTSDPLEANKIQTLAMEARVLHSVAARMLAHRATSAAASQNRPTPPEKDLQSWQALFQQHHARTMPPKAQTPSPE